MSLAATPDGGAVLRCDHPGCAARLVAPARPEAPHEADVDVAEAAIGAGWSLSMACDCCRAHTQPPPAPAPLSREEAERLLRALDAASRIGSDAATPPPSPSGITVRAAGGPEVCVWWGSMLGTGPTEGIALRVLVDARRREVEARAASLAREADHLRTAARRAPALDARAAAIRAALAQVEAPALPGVR